MNIRSPSLGDALALSHYYQRNRDHLGSWEPVRAEKFFTEGFWKERLTEWEMESKRGNAAHFLASESNDSHVIAVCSLTNITRGPFMACNIGFSVSSDFQGKGVARALASHAIDHAFNNLGLNRVMANYLPRNERSARLLESLGFAKEGLAWRYLLINGVWEDHVLTSLINPANA